MYTNLLAKLESEFNRVVIAQQSKPNDLELFSKKAKLRSLINQYLAIERQYQELAGLNNIY